jgi:Cu/Ag efflux pump CusA
MAMCTDRLWGACVVIDRIIAWSLGNRPLVLALSVLFLIAGSWVAVRMPVDVLPDLTAPTVTILVEGRGMAPTDMEALVTFPIETALNGAAGVRRVRSATAVGIAVIWVEFEWGEDIYRARQTVSERVSAVAADLPSGVDPPALAPVSSIMGEILFVALRSDRHDALDAAHHCRDPGAAAAARGARRLTGRGDRRRRAAVPGRRVARSADGGRRVIDRAGGALARCQPQHVGRIPGRHRTGVPDPGHRPDSHAGDIEGTVVTTRDTRPIFVRDLATVRVGEALRRGEGSYNGEPAIILGIQRQPDVNTLQLTRTSTPVFDDIQATLPEGVRIERDVMRQADFIEVALANLNAALRDGTVLVVLVTVVFLANLRAAGITLIAIPLSLLAAVIAFRISV